MIKHTLRKNQSVAPLDNLIKFEYIDLLRGLAILGVIAVHCYPRIQQLHILTSSVFNYGQLGVQLFFVASALTLCLSMNERKEISPMNFYIRRFFRIAPLYYFGIALYFVWRSSKEFLKTNQFIIPEGYSLVAVLENIFFLHGFDPGHYNFVVPGGWSIATEISFYIIFPLLFVIQSKLQFSGFLKFTLVLMLASFLAQFFAIEFNIIANTHDNDSFGFLYCSIVNQINVFLIGILTYQKLKSTHISFGSMILAVLLCIASCLLLNTTQFKTGYNGFIHPILSALAFGIFSIRLSKIGCFETLTAKILIRIGRVSFSMYLIHFLFLEIINFIYQKTIFYLIHVPELKLLVLMTSVVTVSYYGSRLTYATIEKPAINFGMRFTQ